MPRRVRTPQGGTKVARYQLAHSTSPDTVTITTRLAHAGQWIESDLTLPVPKKTAQAFGSAITYGRRYGLMAALGIPADDDDGNAASAPALPPADPSVVQAIKVAAEFLSSSSDKPGATKQTVYQWACREADIRDQPTPQELTADEAPRVLAVLQTRLNGGKK
jgi:hypothetical protein